MLVIGVLLLAIGVLSSCLGLAMIRDGAFGDRYVEFWKGRTQFPLFSSERTDARRRLYGWGYAGAGLLLVIVGIVLLVRT